MDKEFQGKVALVTGGGSGIGRATAIAFASQGAYVFIIDLNASAGEETVNLIKEAEGEATLYNADITKESEVQNAIRQCIEAYGKLDYAHNNAGIVISRSTVECTEDIWDKVINTNLKGTWFCMKHEIAYMQNQGYGVIVNTASISGLIGRRGDMPYNVSKYGIVGLTKTAALENAAKGLRINCVCPGAIHTPWVRRVTKGLNDMHPMGRIGKPEEVADAVLWLCSEKSSFVTGHSLVIDGGRIAGE